MLIYFLLLLIKMNSVQIACLILLIVILLTVILCLGIGEYVRLNYSLQEFKNVDTRKASFTLTTIPSRINHIEPNLKSLIAQGPKTIYLNVPYIFKKTGERYIIPKWLTKYIETGEVTLIRSEDKGPATKFLGILEHNIDPEHYIIVVDDDQIYNDKLLSNLVHKLESLKKDSVVSSNIQFDGTNGYSGNLITGYAGFIFKRKLLNNISKFVWPKECYLVDDVWITEYFKYNGIEMVQLFNVYVPNVSIVKTSDNVISFLKSIINHLPKGSYREKVQEIDALYKDRGFKNLECKNAVVKMLK